jgi:hypothetical protein
MDIVYCLYNRGESWDSSGRGLRRVVRTRVDYEHDYEHEYDYEHEHEHEQERRLSIFE